LRHISRRRHRTIKLWGQKLKIEVVAGAYGADAASVAHDAVTAAQARRRIFCSLTPPGDCTRSTTDAGIAELHRVIGKQLPGAPHEYCSARSTTGMNALNSARVQQGRAAHGLVTKLDARARAHGGGDPEELACRSNSSASANRR